MNVNELDFQIRSLAQKEREILSRLLPVIREMDLCRGYLSFQCTSLFEYLVKIGYSEGSAQRRIDAARLLPSVPDLVEKLESGSIKLSQVSLVKRAIRQTKRAVSDEQTCDLVARLENVNQRDSEKLVASALELPALEKSKRSAQSDGSVRHELTLSPELSAKIQEAQEVLSHSLKTTDLIEYLEFLTNKVLKTSPKKSTATVAVTPKLRREITAAQCSHLYQDGTRCTNRWQMQVDHKHSRWHGGTSARHNLQPLCAQHNRLKYRREAAD